MSVNHNRVVRHSLVSVILTTRYLESLSVDIVAAAVEMQVDAVSEGDKVLIFDDLIATGGTILAASTIIKELGAEVYEAAALIDLPDLHGSELIQQAGIPVYTLLAYEGL